MGVLRGHNTESITPSMYHLNSSTCLHTYKLFVKGTHRIVILIPWTGRNQF